jgi:hypothetical protein
VTTKPFERFIERAFWSLIVAMATIGMSCAGLVAHYLANLDASVQTLNTNVATMMQQMKINTDDVATLKSENSALRDRVMRLESNK